MRLTSDETVERGSNPYRFDDFVSRREQLVPMD